MAETVVIYHGGCSDGFTAAWAASRAHPGARLIPASHGNPPPEDLDTEDEVLIVDFAYPRAQLIELGQRVASLKVLDHHKTAEADLDGLDGHVFDMDRSGAGIAWDELVGTERPWLIDYVEARDLWRLDAYERVREVTSYVATRPHRLEEWDRLAAMSVAEVAELGEGVEAMVRSDAKRAVKRAYLARLTTDPPVTIPLMNASNNVSDSCDLLLRLSGAPIVGYWYQGGDGRYHYGLRAAAGHDSSTIALHFGGGGHAGASGFRTQSPVHTHIDAMDLTTTQPRVRDL